MCISRAIGSVPGSQRSGLKQSGLTMIELVIFIVVVSIAVAGVLSVLNYTTRHSADPLQRKQALAIAEALLAEVGMMPFTYCDPDDRNAANASVAALDATATDPTKCWDNVEAMGPEPGEVRGDIATPFDNVNDYNNFCLGGGFPGTWTCTSSASGDIGSAVGVTVPVGYVARADVINEAFGAPSVANALRITVTVTYNSGADSVVMEGYRAQYAPSFMP